MSRKRTLLRGTFILTITGLTTRFIGFFYRIFLSHTFGENGVGLYQLIFPVFALGFSLTSAGIELALSRCVAKYIALNNKKRAREMLYTSLILTLLFSCAATLLLQKYSFPISKYFLQNEDACELLILMSYAFPFAAVHSCIVGYYFGLKSTRIPALSQLFEQIFRVASVFLLYKFCITYPMDFNISIAVTGLIIGEIASSMFCLYAVTGKLLPGRLPSLSLQTFFHCAGELVRFSLPVTASRVLLNLLQSIEAVSIPVSLITYGLSETDALSTYGVLTGMALPCILFPSAITNSISTMLLPTVSEIRTLNDRRTLNSIVRKTVSSCTLLGVLCCISFLLLGNLAGRILFDSVMAGKFIITLAWMCPFLYTNNTLLSIINGIGKTLISFFINTLNLAIRILSVLLIIPIHGIYGYLIGLLLSQIFVFLCSISFLIKQFKAEVS